MTLSPPSPAGIIQGMVVAYGSFGSQRAPVAMREAYLASIADGGRTARATAAVRTGWAWAEQLFPGRVYDHGPSIPLAERYGESSGVWLGVFGDTVVWMVRSDAELARINRHLGVGHQVRAELVEGDTVTLSYADATAGIERSSRSVRERRAVPYGEPLEANRCPSSRSSSTARTTTWSRRPPTCRRHGRGCSGSADLRHRCLRPVGWCAAITSARSTDWLRCPTGARRWTCRRPTSWPTWCGGAAGPCGRALCLRRW